MGADDDSPELVIGEFSSTPQSPSQSISDFSSQSQSILEPVEVNIVIESNVNIESNEGGNINRGSNNENILVEENINSSMNESINLENDLSASSVPNSGVSKTAPKGVPKPHTQIRS